VSAARNRAPATVYSIHDANAASGMRACSACAGDYEDPEGTAWTPDDAAEPEFEEAPRAGAEEFPAEE